MLTNVADPEAGVEFPKDYYSRVSKVHSSGGYGSIGYRTGFKHDETAKLLLRTHTTAISAAMLYQIANQEGGFKPSKLFSIDRVFRNEAVDATHLAEFHQVEGVVADYGIALGDLIGEQRRATDLDPGPDLCRLVASRFHGGLLRKDGHPRHPRQADVQPLHRCVHRPAVDAET